MRRLLLVPKFARACSFSLPPAGTGAQLLQAAPWPVLSAREPRAAHCAAKHVPALAQPRSIRRDKRCMQGVWRPCSEAGSSARLDVVRGGRRSAACLAAGSGGLAGACPPGAGRVAAARCAASAGHEREPPRRRIGAVDGAAKARGRAGRGRSVGAQDRRSQQAERVCKRLLAGHVCLLQAGPTVHLLAVRLDSGLSQG